MVGRSNAHLIGAVEHAAVATQDINHRSLKLRLRTMHDEGGRGEFG